MARNDLWRALRPDLDGHIEARAPAPAFAWRSVGRWLWQALRRQRRQRRRLATLRELGALDHRLRRDIGLAEASLSDVVDSLLDRQGRDAERVARPPRHAVQTARRAVRPPHPDPAPCQRLAAIGR